MSALPLLFLATAGLEPASMPSIAIDPCVDVDVEEVRRLSAIELGTSEGVESAARLDVAVGCADGAQEVRITDRSSGLVAARSIDLNAPLAMDRDARARELALVIAELVRRAELDSVPEVPPPPPPRRAESALPPPVAGAVHEPHIWRAELGVAGMAARWTEGEVLYGVDAAGRVRIGRWLIAELRLGGRKTRSLELRSGTLDGSGVAAALGLAVDVAPFASGAGVTLGARLGVDWLRYAAVDGSGTAYGGGDAGAVSASGVVTGFVTVLRPLCLRADATLGTALHSVDILDNGRSISRAGGALVSGALGFGAQF